MEAILPEVVPGAQSSGQLHSNAGAFHKIKRRLSRRQPSFGSSFKVNPSQ
jgi:hypothetical protein